MRRLLRNNKGQTRVIEAFFASVLLLSCLAFIPVAQTPVNSSNCKLSSMALNTLVSLDDGGRLSNLIDIRDWATLRSLVLSEIPSTVWFNLTTFDSDSTPLNDVLITNGSPVSENVEAANYVCVSTNASYAVYFLRLQLASVS